MSQRLSFIAALAALLAVCVTPLGAQAQQKARQGSLLVFAAASMKNALDDVDAAFAKQTGIAVVASYDASSALMKQIEQGAPADVFISADLKWMDYGSDKKLMDDKTRVNLLGNKLVLIAGKESKLANVTIGPGLDLAGLSGEGRIATGDVRAVPVGIYAKAALEKLGLWTAVEPKLAMVGNVRTALVLVARGEAPLGIVYATDAKVEPAVKVIGVFPDDSHEPIVYPVAATAAVKSETKPETKPETALYLSFLRSAAARAIFEHYGFSVLLKPVS